jgi:hypothetical protein
MPISFTPPSAGTPVPTTDVFGQRLGTDVIPFPNYYGTDYTGGGMLTIPGVNKDPWGYNKTMTNIVSDPFGYGVNDFSGLNADQQSTARTVQDAFNTSLRSYGRGLERYSMPALASFGEDAALAQARTTASLINSNAQAGIARNLYHDAFNKAPTTMQNLAGLLQLLGGGLNLANQSGLLGLIKKAIGTPSTPASLNQGLGGQVTPPGGGDYYQTTDPNAPGYVDLTPGPYGPGYTPDLGGPIDNPGGDFWTSPVDVNIPEFDFGLGGP